jgi:hypothetical protein
MQPTRLAPTLVPTLIPARQSLTIIGLTGVVVAAAAALVLSTVTAVVLVTVGVTALLAAGMWVQHRTSLARRALPRSGVASTTITVDDQPVEVFTDIARATCTVFADVETSTATDPLLGPTAQLSWADLADHIITGAAAAEVAVGVSVEHGHDLRERVRRSATMQMARPGHGATVWTRELAAHAARPTAGIIGAHGTTAVIAVTYTAPEVAWTYPEHDDHDRENGFPGAARSAAAVEYLTATAAECAVALTPLDGPHIYHPPRVWTCLAIGPVTPRAATPW